MIRELTFLFYTTDHNDKPQTTNDKLETSIH